MTPPLGAVYWVQIKHPDDAEPRIPHPHVVIECDSSGDDVTICAITTNARKFSFPGNVRLERGEANLPKPSAIEVSKKATISVLQLGDYIGQLSEQRIAEIWAGRRLIQRSFLDR